ncbi:MAG: hypothetical protein GOV00_04090 [Candidatus Altiarchaeota archaeon]|nr:hypothetical protein [Candidatus Altiarchaeota archaeon]
MSDEIEIFIESTFGLKVPNENEFYVSYLPIEDEKVKAHLAIYGKSLKGESSEKNKTAELMVVDFEGQNKMFSISDYGYRSPDEETFQVEDVTNLSEQELVRTAVEFVMENHYHDRYFLRYVDLDSDALAFASEVWDAIKNRDYAGNSSTYLVTVVRPISSKYEQLKRKTRQAIRGVNSILFG